MKIRMVPISQIFSRFPRVVRDLSKDLNKKVNLVIEGEETELDKSVIEDLLDPIMHCVRNSLDHGIEHPEDRKKLEKNEEGTLLLKASNEGNQIVIDIADDGAGIDVARVRQKAIDRGLIHPNKILTDQEAYQLIFEPGFSTSDKIPVEAVPQVETKEPVKEKKTVTPLESLIVQEDEPEQKNNEDAVTSGSLFSKIS